MNVYSTSSYFGSIIFHYHCSKGDPGTGFFILEFHIKWKNIPKADWD